jgi:hypothetical protein
MPTPAAAAYESSSDAAASSAPPSPEPLRGPPRIGRRLFSFSRCLAVPSFQQRLSKTGGRLLRHARYVILQWAERHLTQRLFGQILGRIERLTWHPS